MRLNNNNEKSIKTWKVYLGEGQSALGGINFIYTDYVSKGNDLAFFLKKVEIERATRTMFGRTDM